MPKVWVATMTEGEFSETSVYLLGVFKRRKDAESAVDAKIAERESEPDEYGRIAQMGCWERSNSDSTRSSQNRYNAHGVPASAAVTEIETDVRISVMLG